MLERLVGLGVMIASGASLIGIRMLELPGLVTIVLVFGAVALCLCGIVVLFAEEPLLFLHAKAWKVVKYAKVSKAEWQ